MARPLGAKNKLTADVKENIVAVFTKLGGTRAMADWAKDNQTEFYRLYAKMAPHELTGAGGGPVQVEVVKFSE